MQDGQTALREWIREHRVTWEVGPHYELTRTGKLKAGYDLALFARHPPSAGGDPGCRECDRIYRRLHEVALAALPSSRSKSGYVISPFSPAFAMRPESNWEPEVELDVAVCEPGGVAPSDADEALCVHAMEDELRRLGAQPKSWRCTR